MCGGDPFVTDHRQVVGMLLQYYVTIVQKHTTVLGISPVFSSWDLDAQKVEKIHEDFLS